MEENFAAQYNQAKQALQSKHYDEALSLFGKLWDTAKTPQVAWGYGQSLRKAGRLVEAEKFLRQALEQFPDNEWLKKELFWTLYAKEVKPARDRGDLSRLLQIAEQLVDLVEDSWAISRLALTVMKEAKEKHQWDTVLSWANRVEGSQLSLTPKRVGKRKGMADKEEWHLGKSRALYELKRYHEAREVALTGLKEFPQSFFLARLAALALAYTAPNDQHATKALRELEALLTHPRADWYLKADIAKIAMRAGEYQKAQRFIAQALLDAKQEPKYMLSAFATVAELALLMDEPVVSLQHIALAKQVRLDQGWPLPGSLQRLERRANEALATHDMVGPTLPEDSKALFKLCRAVWRTWAFAGEERFTGTLKRLKDKFGFIQRDDSHEDVFVLVRDLPKKARKVGARVEFSIVKSFDKKKNRESTRAVQIILLQEQSGSA